MRYLLLMLLIGLVAAQTVVFFWQRYYAQQQYESIQNELPPLNQFLESETTLSQAIGALRVLGLNGRTLKEQALGELPNNDTEVLKRLAVIQQLYAVDGVYVLNKDGEIVAHQTSGKSSLGTKVPWRPYFQQAMKGITNVYPAVGSSSGERGLYFAAPIYRETTVDSPIIGVIMLKKSISPIDAHLNAKTSGIAFLVSPQGVVFSSNHSEWLYHVLPPLSSDALTAIVKQKQFGKTFENEQAKPQQLPISDLMKGDKQILFNNMPYMLGEHSLDLSDALGAWRLILMRPATLVLSNAQAVLVYAGVPLFVLLLGLFARWQGRQWHTRRDTEKRIRAAETRTLLLIDAVDDGILGIDNQGSIIFANPAASLLLGIDQPDDLLKQTLTTVLFANNPLEQKRAGVQDALRYGEKHHFMRVLVSAEGVERQLDITLLPLRTSDGWDGFVLVFRDVSEQQRVQQQMQQQMDELMLLNRVAVDRELTMIKLKTQINELLASIGKEAVYVIAE